MHGGKAPQVERQREARLALAHAQAMYADEYSVRDPGEVLLAAVPDGDTIVQKLKHGIQTRETLTGTDLLALGDCPGPGRADVTGGAGPQAGRAPGAGG
jgi:hypothetical protein